MSYVDTYCETCGWSGKSWVSKKKCGKCKKPTLVKKALAPVYALVPCFICGKEVEKDDGGRFCISCGQHYCHTHKPVNTCPRCQDIRKWYAQIVMELRKR